MKLDLRDDPSPDLSRAYTHCPLCGRKLRWDVIERETAYDDDGELYTDVTAMAGRCANGRCRVVQVAVEMA